MFGNLVHQLGKVAYPLFERFSSIPWDHAPRPPSARAVTHGAGHDPDRVLLIGGSSSVGWGVVSHELGLAGRLARATAAATGRGADVEVYSYPRLDIPTMRRELTPATISRFDAIVMTLGGRESFELMPTSVWRTQLTSLLDHISVGRNAGPSVIIVGAEETSPITLGRFVNSMAMNRARALNETTRETIAHRPRVTFVDSAYTPIDTNKNGVLEEDQAALYKRAARAIAPTLAVLLDRAPDRLRNPVDDDARVHALRHIQSQEGTDHPRIAELLSATKAALHMRSADLFFVDRDRVRLLGATNVSVTEGPRERALSSETLEHPAGLVIPDLAADARHSKRPEVVGPPHLRFYAGFPVESPDGHPVAVLTVVDTIPRDITPAELALLRQFALKAGAILFENY